MTTLPDRVANAIFEMVEDAQYWGVTDLDDIIAEVRECWCESLRDEEKRIRVETWKRNAR